MFRRAHQEGYFRTVRAEGKGMHGIRALRHGIYRFYHAHTQRAHTWIEEQPGIGTLQLRVLCEFRVRCGTRVCAALLQQCETELTPVKERAARLSEQNLHRWRLLPSPLRHSRTRRGGATHLKREAFGAR